MHFIGREEELGVLNRLLDKKTSSFVCITGRRRIGKSALIKEFGKNYRKYFSVQGLAPDQEARKEDQLKHFSKEVSRHFQLPKVEFQDWEDAFIFLAKKTKKGHHLIVLDEVSWLAAGDSMFSSKLKDVWDRHFKNNPELVLIICGSVSSWIQENILNHTSFVGRVSLSMNIQELPLNKLNLFWPQKEKISSFEKMLTLSVTGGIPRYMEEIIMTQTGEKNILRLCFHPSGILNSDFNRIFNDVFGRRHQSMEKIVRSCLDFKQSPVELAQKLRVNPNSEFYENLEILQLAGFLARDHYFKPNGDVSKLSQLRIKDNYVRFYLKYIEPNKERMNSKEYKTLFDLKGFEGVLGLQFENLILSNVKSLYPFLDLPHEEIISAAPFLQKKNSVHKVGCQIDLLIHTRLDVFYLCEMKCRKIIDRTVIGEVEKKSQALKLPKRSSLRPVLVYEGEIYPPHKEEIQKYFYRIIHFGDLLQA